jgi:nucleotide-binding universal stress UspA family protein
MMKILVPLDGSECSETAIPWARLLAEGQGADVHLIRSYLPFANVHLSPQLPITVAELVNEHDQSKDIEEYLKQKASEFGDIQVTTECVQGHAGHCILEGASDADLIVMASHGTSGITRWLLGSVATKVVRGSDTPVLVVNAREDEAPPPIKLDRILVALDESERAEVALREAARLTKAFDATLILYEGIVNVWKTSGPDNWASDRAAEYMKSKVESLSDIETETEVYRSSIGPEIVEQAEELKADLVVMCSHGRSGLSRWALGSVTESVVQRATCPVLVYYNRPK